MTSTMWHVTYYPPRNSVVYALMQVREDEVILDCIEWAWIGRNILDFVEVFKATIREAKCSST